MGVAGKRPLLHFLGGIVVDFASTDVTPWIAASSIYSIIMIYLMVPI